MRDGACRHTHRTLAWETCSMPVFVYNGLPKIASAVRNGAFSQSPVIRCFSALAQTELLLHDREPKARVGPVNACWRAYTTLLVEKNQELDKPRRRGD